MKNPLSLWAASPWRGTTRLGSDWDRLIEEFWGATPALRQEWSEDAKPFFSPRCDVELKGNQYLISLDIPGVKPKDVKVALNGRRLTIAGERRAEERTEGSVHRLERFYGRFERSFDLPEEVNHEKIEAKFEDGVLRVTLPRAESAPVREIPVRG